MEVIVDGRRAVVKPGASVQYVDENRAFSKSDGYTLAIEFPLRGCQANKDIFGHLNRKDVARGLVRLDAELRCGATFARYGTLTVVSASEDLVKCQFLEGRSAQNFDATFDNVYINELDLGYPSVSVPDTVDGWKYYGSVDTLGVDYVCLPWVNSASGVMQNEIDVTTRKMLSTHISVMPYLIRLTGWILRAVGYDYDLRAWKQTKHRHLLCCNVLPAAWESRNLADALPHWSLTEYLEQLERLLVGWFDVDHREKTVVFRYASADVSALGEVVLDDVADAFDVETSDKDDSDFGDTAVYKYAARDDDDWKWLSCQSVVDGYRGHYYEFALWHDFFKDLLNGAWSARSDLRGFTPGFGGSDGYEWFGKLYRVAEYDTYFGMRCVGTTESDRVTSAGEKVQMSQNKPQMLNIYGSSRENAGDNVHEEELSIVPARVDMTDYGLALFVAAPSDDSATDCDDADYAYEKNYSGDGRSGKGSARAQVRARYSDGYDASWRQSPAVRACVDDGGKAEYFSLLYVAYWDGIDYFRRKKRACVPCPIVDKLTFYDEGDSLEGPLWLPQYSLRLSDRELEYGSVADGRGSAVDVYSKYTFTFFADSVPPVRSVFVVHGQRFVCAKITVTLGDDGLSRMMKGEFYRLLS